MILPADKNRKSLHLRVSSAAATPALVDSVFIADELSKLAYLTGSSSGAVPIVHAAAPSLDDHTGAVWAVPGPNITAAITLMWIAVTI